MKKILLGTTAVVALSIGMTVPAMSADYAAYLAKGSALGFDAVQVKDDQAVIGDLKDVIEALGKGFEEFKSKNDARIAEIEAKGSADPLLEAQVDKINDALTALTEQKTRLDQLEAKANRPGAGGGGEGESAESIEHRAAFKNFLRDATNPAAQTELKTAEAAFLQSKAVNITTAGDGGYAVPEEISRQINAKIVDFNPMRDICRVVTVGTSDYKELVDVGGEAYGWVGEGDARSETGTGGLEEAAPTFGIVYAYPKASEESLQDIFFDVESWVIDRSSKALARGEGVSFIDGNGTKKPTGFLNGTPVSTGDEDSPARAFGTLQYVPTGTAASFGPSRIDSPAGDPGDVFMTTIQTLKQGYRGNANWLMNTTTTGVIRRFKDANGDYLWRPGLEQGQASSLLGYSVIEMPSMPDIGANTFPVAFGDFEEGYVICDRAMLRITRDEITTPGYVKFYVRKRVGGIMTNDDAIKAIKCAAS